MSKTLEKLIQDCRYQISKGEPAYKTTIQCDWLLINLLEIKKDLTTPKTK